MNLLEALEAKQRRADQGPWVPACAGTETPFTTRGGFRLLYCWQPSSGRHAYLNLDADMFLTTDEALRALEGGSR